MEIVMWYTLFAVTTSLASMYELIIPVMQILENKEPNNNVVEYKWVAYITFFLATVLTAPVILPSCVIPSLGERFRASLLNSLS
jgi:hypothetical protein